MELAFESPAYFDRKDFFAEILRFILEHTFIEKELDPSATHTKHGLRYEVLTRLLQAIETSTSPHFEILEECEAVATKVAVHKSAEISRVQQLYEHEQNKNGESAMRFRTASDRSEASHKQSIL